MRLFFILVTGCLLASFSSHLEAFSVEDATTFHDQIVNETREHLRDASLLPKPTPTPSTSTNTYPSSEEVVRTSSAPIPPKLGYAPIVIVNNTGFDASRLYFLGTGTAIGGAAHFLKPNRTTGICSYAFPKTSNSADRNISVRLSSLPTDGAGSYYLYLPQQISGRCYISVDRPLYIQTTDETIGSPSVTASNDPNYYTLYQSFELTLNADYDLYADVSHVDYYSLPMGLSSFTYPTGSPYPTLDNLTASGFSISTSRQTVLTTVGNSLKKGDKSVDPQWKNLIVPFYEDPYVDSTPLTDLRILSPKQSIGFAAGLFKDAANPQKAFSSSYLQSMTSGPVSGMSYMTKLAQFYASGESLTFVVYPAGQPPAKYRMKAVSGTQLKLSALTSGAMQTYLDLSKLSTLDLFGGDVETWNASGVFNPAGTNVWYTEIVKLLSALFSVGQLPPSSELLQPIDSKDSYFSAYRDLYFSSPEEFSLHGPWYNLYDAAMHPLMVKKNGFGLGYVYDFDDLLDIGGEMHVNIQTDGVSNPDNPYFELTLGPIDTEVPNPTAAYGAYTLTIHSIAQSAKPINIVYSTSAGSGPKLVQAVPQSGSSITLSNLYNEFWVQYDPDGSSSSTYVVYPKHQFVIPKTKRYNATDASLISEILFSVVDGRNFEFTLSLPSL